MKYIKLCVIFSFLIYFVAVVGVKLLNFSGKLIVQENSLVETLSAILFLSASLLAIYMLITKHFSNRFHMLWLAGIAGFGLLGCLDEISFGGNYIPMPTMLVDEVKIDGVHDIGILLYAIFQQIYENSPVTAVILALIPLSVLVVLIIVAIKKRDKVWSTVSNPQDYPLYFFLVAFVGCIGLAMFIDLDVIKIRGLYVLEELLELNASLPLIFAALYIQSLSKAKVILIDEIAQPT